MANLTIRNIDDTIVAHLKQRAKQHNRSLEAELRTILCDVVAASESTDLAVLAQRIAAMTPDTPQTDSAELLRQDRDR